MRSLPANIQPVADPVSPPVTRGIVLDHAAGVYDLLSPPMMLWQEQRANTQLVNQLAIKPEHRLLDVGCATGNLTARLARHLDPAAGGMAVGLDASPAMIATARKKRQGPACRFDLGIAEKLPYPDDCFDHVVSSFFFHHLCREDKQRALHEIHRVLRPDGTCLIADLDCPISLMGRIWIRTAERLFNQSEIGENADGVLRRLFAPSGFSRWTELAHFMGYITLFRLLPDPSISTNSATP